MSPSRRPIRHWIGLLIVLVGLSWVSTATATTALKLDLQSLVANSNAIVLGDVTEVRSFRKEGRIYTETTIRVDEAWKGESTETVTIQHPGGRIGDTVTRVFGLPGFEPKERVVVFLSRARASDAEEQASTPFTVTGLRQGKFHVAIGPDASTQFVVPRLGDMQLLEPKEDTPLGDDDTSVRDLKNVDVTKLKSADPAPIHEKVLSLDQFRERVKQAVDPADAKSSEGGAE